MSQLSAGPGKAKMAQWTNYPLLDALLSRRSRRFAPGFELNGGPLAYQDTGRPEPLTFEEEAVLAFAACGVTGPILTELPFQPGTAPEAGSGNIIINQAGRTVPSGDAVHAVSVFVINDQGTWLLKRPQDFPRTEIGELVEAARQHKFGELYEKSRVQIADRRLDVPRELPFVPPFNKWSANQPGSTYFLPVNEYSTLNINMCLAAFNEEFGYFVLDDRNGYRPAGLTKFARSKGGHLYDDPAKGRAGTISYLETWLCEFTALEQGAIIQNLGLMTAALGLGGFAHFAAQPYIWPQTLGFKMDPLPLSKTIGANLPLKLLLKILKKDLEMPTPLGLELAGQPILKPFCPPYYRNMEEAVLAFVDYKYAQGTGTLKDGGQQTAWLEGERVQAGIPRYTDRTIAATIAYCDYVYKRYGRFPSQRGPFGTVLAFQAHRLALDFYKKFYKTDSYSFTNPQSTVNLGG